MDTRPITAITRRQLREMIAIRSPRNDRDGKALYILRRSLRSLELFCTPDTIGGDLALDICHAIDELEGRSSSDLLAALKHVHETNAKDIDWQMVADTIKAAEQP